MSDEVTMRARLQTVAAYRELRRSVARSGRENVAYAVVMLVIAYFIHQAGGLAETFALVCAVLAIGELLVGLCKWLVPSAEALILDAFVLLAFAALNGWIAYNQFQRRGQPGVLATFFTLYLLMG